MKVDTDAMMMVSALLVLAAGIPATCVAQPDPRVTEVVPASVTPGEAVILRGEGFSPTADDNVIVFLPSSSAAEEELMERMNLGLRAEAAARNELRFTMPASESASTALYVRVGGRRSNVVPLGIARPAGPRITEVIPPAVYPGGSVTLKGEGFSPNPKENVILRQVLSPEQEQVLLLISRSLLVPTNATETELQFKMPETEGGATTCLLVRVGTRKSNVVPIDVIRPLIVRMSPTNAAPGQKVTLEIEGKFTHFRQGVTKLEIGGEDGQLAKVESFEVESTNKVKAVVSVSEYAPQRTLAVKASTGNEIVHYNFGFTVRTEQGPVVEQVESLDPGVVANADGSDRVRLSFPGMRIRGRNFQPNMVESRVFCGGRECVVMSASRTALVAYFPRGQTEGDVYVQVGNRKSDAVRVKYSPQESATRTVEVSSPPARPEVAAPAATVAPSGGGRGGAWPSLKLVGVMAGRGGSKGSAFINNRAVTTGDEIDGVRLVGVDQTGVTLELNGQTQHVRIGQSTH